MKKIRLVLDVIRQRGAFRGALYLMKRVYALRKDLPHTVNFETTSICNLKCPFCYPHSTGDIAKRTVRVMPLGLYKRIIDQIESFATSVALHGSGEPLLHKDIFAMIAYAKDKGLSVSFSTNGLLLTETIIQKLIASQIDKMIFSIDGVTYEQYSMHRQPVSREAFENLISMSRKLNTEKLKNKTGKPHTVFQYIVTKYNYDKVQEVAGFARELGFDEAVLMTLSVEKDVGDNKFIDRVSSFLPDDKAYMRYEKGRGGDIVLKEGGGYCRQLVKQPMITAGGEMLPCCRDLHKMNFIMGNLNNDTFINIWLSGNVHRMRDMLKKRQAKMCKYCFPDTGEFEIKLFGI